MNKYRFVISVFGEKHIGMLLTNLYSITKNIPNYAVTVFWQEINDEIKSNFKKVFPRIDFIDTNFDLSSDKIKRISSKTLLWNYAAQNLKNQKLCFLDVDMLVIKDISSFFEDEFDILFTYKEERFPLNTGVILCKGDYASLFFGEWLKQTLKVLSSEDLIQQSISLDYPYGGSDQMAFYKILDYKKGTNKYEVILNGKRVIAKGVPCNILNETRSTEITDDLHIIHYKGGWQMILLEGEGFTKNRPKRESWDMYVLYLKTYKEALNYLSTILGKDYPIGSFGIKIPFYLDPKDFTEVKMKYLLFSLVFFFSRIIRKIKDIIKK